MILDTSGKNGILFDLTITYIYIPRSSESSNFLVLVLLISYKKTVYDAQCTKKALM